VLSHDGERAVGHALDLVAPDDAGTVEADLTADVLGDKLVVAREDLHDDAVAAELAERLGDAFHRRIEEGHETGEHELALVAGRIHAPERPVRAACWWRSRASRRRASAGTRSPAASRTMSPGISSRRRISLQVPSRRPVAVGATASRSRSATRWER
jgi:hypothetical protein